MLPEVDLEPPFNITRFSHVVLEVADVARSREFYTRVGGLVESGFEEGVCYLRAVAEACHHSLVLRPAKGPSCRRIGFRVWSEADLDRAHAWFTAQGLPATWGEVPHQGRTLLASDPVGTALEFCATMEVMPRRHLDIEDHRGAAAHQLDHCQIVVPALAGASAFYAGLGFRTSEYIAAGDKLVANFTYRKGLCLDLALVEGVGPRLHHFAYTVAESHFIFAACDMASRMGYAAGVERGPGRHGPSGVLFVYLRDPDGHRVEFFTGHYATVDIELEPIRWEAASLSTNVHWGLPAPARWYFEASEFTGVPVAPPAAMPDPMTLEKYAAALLARG